MPIMAFHSFTPETSNLENFLNFKKAGFTINHTMFKTNDQVESALNLAQKAGIKVMFYSDELRSDTEKTVKRFMNHPALYGYFIGDEPSPKDFANAQQFIKKIKAIDSKHAVYVNLYPNFVWPNELGNLKYEDYVSQFIKDVSIDFISFDHYPLFNNYIREQWYQNLEIIRDASMRSKKNFWAFACSTIHANYLQPILGGLKLQQFSNLLYGAKGLQYFTYITMDDDFWKKHNFSYSIVYNNGKPTPTYELVKKVNKQIKNLSWLFINSKVDAVYHIGNEIPIGTKKMDFIPEKFTVFNSATKPALVSYMSIGSKKYILVQNKNIYEPISFNYKVNSGVNIIDRNTGKTKSISTKNQTENIPPGDILIFAYK